MSPSVHWGVVFVTGTSICTVVFGILISRILSNETKPMTNENEMENSSEKSSDIVTIKSSLPSDVDSYIDIDDCSTDVVDSDENEEYVISSCSEDMFRNVIKSVIVDENRRLAQESEARASVEENEYHERLTISTLQYSFFSEIESSFVSNIIEGYFDVTPRNHFLEKTNSLTQYDMGVNNHKYSKYNVDTPHEELPRRQLIKRKPFMEVGNPSTITDEEKIDIKKSSSLYPISYEEQLMLQDTIKKRQMMELETLVATYELGRSGFAVEEQREFLQIERSDFVARRILVNFANEQSSGLYSSTSGKNRVASNANETLEVNVSLKEESHHKLVESPRNMIVIQNQQGELPSVSDETNIHELKAALEKIDQEANKLVSLHEQLTKTVENLNNIKKANEIDQVSVSSITAHPISDSPISIFGIHGPRLPAVWEIKSVDYSHPLGRAVIHPLDPSGESQPENPETKKQNPEILIVVEDLFYKDSKIKTSENFCTHCVGSFSSSSKDDKVNVLQSSPANKLKPAGFDWFCQFTVTLSQTSYRALRGSESEGGTIVLKLIGLFSLIDSIGYAVILHYIDGGDECEMQNNFMQFVMTLEITPVVRRKRAPNGSFVQYLLYHQLYNRTVNIPLNWRPLTHANDIPLSFEVSNFDTKEVVTILMNDTDSKVKIRSEAELDGVVVGRILRSATVRKAPVTHQRIYYGEILSFPLLCDILYTYTIEEHCFGQFELTLKISATDSSGEDEMDVIITNLAVISSSEDPLVVRLKRGLEAMKGESDSEAYIGTSDEGISKLLFLTKKTSNRWLLQDWTVARKSIIEATTYANELAQHTELQSMTIRSSY